MATRPYVYRTSFSRHLYSLMHNGFWARDLDADDHAFLEYVKARGIANGTLCCTDTVSLEELEFWQRPYTIQPDIVRKAGPVPIRARPPETPEQREQRLARSSRWWARRAIREHEKAIAAAELEREQREHEQAKERRKLRERITDAEWNAAAPTREIRFGKVEGRHFVPQWKLDERGELNKADERARRKREKVAREARARRREQKAREAQEHRERLEQQAREAAEREATAFAQDAFNRAARQELARREREQIEREQIAAERVALEAEVRERMIEDARKTIERVNRLERGWRDMPPSPADAEKLKRTVLDLLRNTAPHVWTVEELSRSTGCADQTFLKKCLDELVRDGRLRKKDAA